MGQLKTKGYSNITWNQLAVWPSASYASMVLSIYCCFNHSEITSFQKCDSKQHIIRLGKWIRLHSLLLLLRWPSAFAHMQMLNAEEALQFNRLIVIHPCPKLRGQAHCVSLTKSRIPPPSRNSPRSLAERRKAAVAPFIPSGDRVLMIIARTMPCMCQTIGK